MEKNKKTKQPEFFSNTLSICLRTFNWMFSFYVIFSIIFSLFYFYLGKDTVSNKILDIDRFIIDNIYYSAVIILLVMLGYVSSEKKSLTLFTTYMIAINMLSLNYFFEFIKMTPGNHIHRVINWMIILQNIIIIGYFTLYYLNSIGYFKTQLEGIPFYAIEHEVKLRIDMMKINFNSFLINSKLYKIFPNLLFRKSDYYFMNTQDNSEETDRVEELKSSNRKNYNNSEAFYSGSTIDAEYEPLK
jgi:hypothetical protein